MLKFRDNDVIFRVVWISDLCFTSGEQSTIKNAEIQIWSVIFYVQLSFRCVIFYGRERLNTRYTALVIMDAPPQIEV